MKTRFLLSLVFLLLAACTEGPNQDGLLESCGDGHAFFSAHFVDGENLSAIAPLGTINPPHHTYPTAHMYPALTSDQMVPLYSPGNAVVTSITRTRWIESNFRQGHADYSIRVQPCNEVMMTIGHVTELTAEFTEKVGAMTNCVTRSTPQETVEECTQSLLTQVSAGEQLGRVGQPGLASGFDWGLIDTRVTNYFVNPDRQEHLLSVACPIDYFTPSLKAELEALTGRTEGPLCGEVAYDIAGTAQGVWVLESQVNASYIEEFGLTLGKDHLNPLEYVIGMARIGADLDERNVHFTPMSSGLIDRDFADVTADGQVYCFDHYSARILIELQDDGVLLLETQAGQVCSAGAYSFTSNQLRFVR